MIKMRISHRGRRCKLFSEFLRIPLDFPNFVGILLVEVIRMKNRITAALLATAILLSLAGCGHQAAEETSNAENQRISAAVDTEAAADENPSVDTEQTEKKETDAQSETPAGSVEHKEPSESTEETEASATQPAETKPQCTQTEQPADTAEPKTETVQSVTEPKAEETKPAETTPTQTETTEPPKTEETKPAEPEETIPAVTMPTRPAASEIEPLVAQYLNEYRSAQGSGSMTVLPGLTEVARFRAEQLITDFSHNSNPDACTMLQYGEYIDMTELGLDASHNYYQGYDAEACAKGNWSGSAEDIARKIADGFRNSSGHWRYLGSSEYTYMAVGLTYDTHTAKWYCCVCVSSKNYGG